VSTSSFDPKVARVKLRGRIPDDFDPKEIDDRLYSHGRVTLIGLWHVKPGAAIFTTVDELIRDIRSRILESPGVAHITAADIAKRTKLQEEDVANTLFALGHLGMFFSSTSSQGESNKITSIGLEGDDAYNEYLRYKDLDELLERYYVQ
jgi:hypothetical protein